MSIEVTAAKSLETHPEIGKRLRPFQLKLDTIYVLTKPLSNHAITMWCTFLSCDAVHFTGAAVTPSVTLVLWVDPNGEMHDDSGSLVVVREYLGEP